MGTGFRCSLELIETQLPFFSSQLQVNAYWLKPPTFLFPFLATMGGRRNKLLAMKVAKQFGDKAAEEQDSDDDEEEEVPETKSLNKMASLQMYSSSEEEENEEEEEEVQTMISDENNCDYSEDISNTLEETEKTSDSGQSNHAKKKKNKKKKNKSKNMKPATTSTTVEGSKKGASVNTISSAPFDNLDQDKPLVGKEVEIVGTKRPDLNGKRGKVIDFNPTSSRYNVELRPRPVYGPPVVIALKRDNIVDTLVIDRYIFTLLLLLDNI